MNVIDFKLIRRSLGADRTRDKGAITGPVVGRGDQGHEALIGRPVSDNRTPFEYVEVAG